MADRGAGAEGHELLGQRTELFYARTFAGTTVGHRSASRRRTYALSEGLAGRTVQRAVWRPHEAHVRVVAKSASRVSLAE